jgi:hypothetical protein
VLTVGAQLLVLAVVVLAAWIVAHVALLVRVLLVTEITTRQRWIALIPLATPWYGWKYGKRWHVLLWGCLFALYLALRAGLALR